MNFCIICWYFPVNLHIFDTPNLADFISYTFNLFIDYLKNVIIVISSLLKNLNIAQLTTLSLMMTSFGLYSSSCYSMVYKLYRSREILPNLETNFPSKQLKIPIDMYYMYIYSINKQLWAQFLFLWLLYRIQKINSFQ